MLTSSPTAEVSVACAIVYGGCVGCGSKPSSLTSIQKRRRVFMPTIYYKLVLIGYGE
jgi:hypothetical protein